MNINKKIEELGIKLPNPPDPVGSYVAFKIIGNLLYISGQLPISNDGKMIKGTIGKDLNIQEAQKASKYCVLNILAQAKKAMGGDLDRIKKLCKK